MSQRLPHQPTSPELKHSDQYYMTLAEIAASLRVTRTTIHRWMNVTTGIICCPNGRSLKTVKFGEYRLVARTVWERFVAVDDGPEQVPGKSLPSPPARRGRPRQGGKRV